MKQTCNSKNQESRVTEVSEVADASMYHLSVEELLELSLRTERGKWAEPLPYGFCGEEGIWPGSKLHKLHLRLPSQTLWIKSFLLELKHQRKIPIYFLHRDGRQHGFRIRCIGKY